MKVGHQHTAIIYDRQQLQGEILSHWLEVLGLMPVLYTTATDCIHALQTEPPQLLILAHDPADMGLSIVLEALQSSAPLNVLLAGRDPQHLQLEFQDPRLSAHHVIGSIAVPYAPTTLETLLTQAQLIPQKVSEDNAFPASKHTNLLSQRELEDAIEQRKLHVHYQPVLEAKSHALVGFESLLRWHDAPLQPLLPTDIIEAAKRYQLHSKVCLYLLDLALSGYRKILAHLQADQGAQLRSAPRLSMGIDLSVFDDVQMIQHIKTLVLKHQIPLDDLIIEIAETAIDPIEAETLQILQELSSAGFRLAIDHYQGHSLMADLVQLPIQEIKLDASLLITAKQSKQSLVLTRGIVGFARGIGLVVTGVGIENSQTLGILEHIGCTQAQGHLIAPAMSCEDVLAWLQDRASEYERMRIEQTLRSGLLDSAQEARFDRITHLAQNIFGVSISLFSVLDVHRQWFKSRVGLKACETDRSVSFCSHELEETELLIIPDATLDHRFHNNPLVTHAPHIRFYAGHAVRTPDSGIVGRLCLIDSHPRTLNADEKTILQRLAAMIELEVADNLALSLHPHSGLFNPFGFELRARPLLQLFRLLRYRASLLLVRVSAAPNCLATALPKLLETLTDAAHPADLLGQFAMDEFVLMSGRAIHQFSHTVERLQQVVSAQCPDQPIEIQTAIVDSTAEQDYRLESLYLLAHNQLHAG